MSIDALRAAEAYTQAARAAASPAARDGGADFAQLVQSSIAEVAGSIALGERAAGAVAAGKADLVEVVTALAAAETSLQTAVAIRNRMIDAYQDIMRMPI